MGQPAAMKLLEHLSMVLLDLLHKGVQERTLKQQIKEIASALKKARIPDDYRNILKMMVDQQPELIAQLAEQGQQLGELLPDLLMQLEERSDCQERYREVSELLERTLRVIAKIPREGGAFQEKLSGIKEKIQGAKSVKDVRMLKEELLGNIQDIESGLEEMGSEVNELLNFQLKHAHATIEQLQIELKRSEAAAMYDPLTGALNRQWMNRRFEELFWFGQQEQMAGLMIDIDHFKQVNDTYGHPVGDEVLRILTLRIQKLLREQEYLIRMGGEEFLVLIRGENLLERTEEIRGAIGEKRFQTARGNLEITISIGASFFHEAAQPDIFIELTDQKLYTAKTRGRNCSVLNI